MQFRLQNTGANVRLGAESSAGNTAQVGTSAYAAFFGNQANAPTEFTTNGTMRMHISSAGSVGIGTSSPASDKALQINNGSGTFVRMTLTNTATGTAGSDGLSISVENNKAIIKNQENEDLVLGANNSETQLVLRANGYVNAGTGVIFGADTAAANLLDDYEEGTFTATLKGSTTDPTTPVTTTGTYTKIGRQVAVSIIFANVDTTGAAGSVSISGMPFSCVTSGLGAVTTENFTFGLTRTSVNSFLDSSAATTMRLFVSGNDTAFESVTHNAGAGRYLYTSLTYFV
jgi:hypothetical protein